MSENDNREQSRALAAQINTPALKEFPARQLGLANYAWLKKSKAAKPFDTPDGAGQCYSLLRKGASLGTLNITRLSAFLDAIEGDPAEFVAKWASNQNGASPNEDQPAKEPPPELVISEEVQQALSGAFGQVRLLHDQKRDELARREEELQSLRAEVRQMAQILKAAGLMPREHRNGSPGRKPASETEPKKKSKNSHVSDETALKILEQIKSYVAANPPALEDVPGSFTRPAVEKTLGLHHSQVGAAIAKLRDQGHIRAAGLSTNDRGMKVNVFAVVS